MGAQAQRPAGTNCRLPCVTAVTCCVDNTNKGDRALQKGVLKRKGQPAQTAGFRVSRLSHAALTTQTRETEPCEKACSSAKATRHKLQTYAGGHSFRTFYVTNIVMKRDTGTQGTQQIHTAETGRWQTVLAQQGELCYNALYRPTIGYFQHFGTSITNAYSTHFVK